MPSTKISELTAMTTAAAGDLLVAVDIADTTMAPSGTDKKITAGELLTSGLPAEFSTFDGPGGSGLVGFGGLTSGEPALKRNGTELQVRLADDSGYATVAPGAVKVGKTALDSGDNGYGWVGYNSKIGIHPSAGDAIVFWPAGVHVVSFYNSTTFGVGIEDTYPIWLRGSGSKIYGENSSVTIRDSTNPQTLRVYGTYTDPSNHVRASLGATSTAVTLAAETAGTGADNIDINIAPAGTGRTVIPTGNVGIGTQSPTNQLHILNATASAIYRVETNLTTGFAIARLVYDIADRFGELGYAGPSTLGTALTNLPNSLYLRTSNSATNGVVILAQGGPIRFATGGTSLSNERMRIDSAGLVGIGTTSPTAYLDLPASTTSAASLRIRTGTAPTSPNSGDVWHDSTQQTVSYRAAGVNQTVNGVLFTQTDTVTVADTVTETDLTGTGVGTLTLPANFFVEGKTLKIRALGYHSSTASPDITLRFKLGSTTVLTTGAITSGNGTDEAWICDAFLTCRTTGATGTVIGQGYYDELHGIGSVGGMVNTAATTIDTTASQAISLTVEWGTANAGNTISCTNVLIEILN